MNAISHQPILRMSGSIGLVLRPDDDTCHVAEQLAKKVMPDQSEYVAINPHITLFHAKITEAPFSELESIRQKVTSLIGLRLELNDVVAYGGKFLFWNITQNKALQEAHSTALTLATFLDRSSLARAKEEALSLSAAEQENLAQFGHPLVGDLYLPHITLGYCASGIDIRLTQRKALHIKSVQLVKIGSYGTVDEVLSTNP